MASTTNSTDQKRTRLGRSVPVNLPGHNGFEAADRDGRQQGWPIEICQTREIGYQIEICPRLAIQLPPSGSEGFRLAHHGKTIASGSCKFLYRSIANDDKEEERIKKINKNKRENKQTKKSGRQRYPPPISYLIPPD